MAMVSLPLILIEPLREPTRPMIERSVVVRPAPLRPSSVTTSPLFTDRLTLCRMCDSPYQDCRSEISNAGVPPTADAAPPCCNVAVLISVCSFQRAGSGTHVGFHHLRILRY